MPGSKSHPPNEYERTPVPAEAQKGPGKFWGMYAGEHAAGTEFMIGPLFLLNGVTLQNIFLGLLVGNILAVLSWRYLCAPIATKARMTLYFHLEKIAGKQLVKFYNLANGVLFCFLAGAMITVAATAVGIPFQIEMPALDALYPNNLTFVIIVIAVGSVITLVAARGYDTVARFANVASPWMILVFLACGIIALKQIGAADWEGLKEVWTQSITVAQEGKDTSVMGFWSVALFAWFCNSAMHIGMADLSIFRYARKPSSGWAAAGGMFVGHYMAWIAAAFMLAAQIKLSGNTSPNPGIMAANAAGIAGIVCVVVAGWTTANPTIYRAGLAFQAMIPGSSRSTMTLVAGLVATVAGIFPAFAFRLLDFVGFYGTVLAPMGAVIFADWYFASPTNFTPFAAEKTGIAVNPSVLLAWLIPVTIAVYFIKFVGINSWFCILPCWVATAILHIVFSKTLIKKRT
ncbi:MAG: purine-cytosine permease-like protein [Akkermansiaceae bacterium]|jgi:purine-cytosine permease-like protein